jgi:hypothetical protein
VLRRAVAAGELRQSTARAALQDLLVTLDGRLESVPGVRAVVDVIQ